MNKAQAARRPAQRTVTVELDDGDFAGWGMTMRADFPARILAILQAPADTGAFMEALDQVVLTHNMPDTDGGVATRMADVDPWDGVVAVAGAAFEAIGKLPPR